MLVPIVIDPSSEGINVSPFNQCETIIDSLCEEIESPSKANIGMVDVKGQQHCRVSNTNFTFLEHIA